MPFAKSPLVSPTNNNAIRIVNTIAVAFIVLDLPNFFASVIVILVVVAKCMAEYYPSKVIVLFSLSNFTLCVPFIKQHRLIKAGSGLGPQAQAWLTHKAIRQSLR